MREPSTVTLTSLSADQTQAFGSALGQAILRMTGATLVFAFEGALGAGKTTFVRGILRALGVAGPIRSPTYTLIEPYAVANRSVYHLDLYRIADSQEVDTLGIRDLLTFDAVLLVEWASRAEAALPVPDLAVSIDFPSGSETERRLELVARSSRGSRLMAALLPVTSE